MDIGDGIWLLLNTLGLGHLVLHLNQELAATSPHRRRSIVRILGSVLPLKPVERPYLRYECNPLFYLLEIDTANITVVEKQDY